MTSYTLLFQFRIHVTN